MSAQRIDHLGSLTNQKASRLQHHRCCLLLGRFDWNKAHCLANHGLTDRLGVGGIRLAPLDERLDLGRRVQPHLVTECRDLARLVTRAAAGLKGDQTHRLLLEKPQHLGAVELSIDDWRTLGVSAVDLKNLLGQIQPDGGNLRQGTALTLWRLDNDHVWHSDAAVAGRSTSSNETASGKPGAVQ